MESLNGFESSRPMPEPMAELLGTDIANKLYMYYHNLPWYERVMHKLPLRILTRRWTGSIKAVIEEHLL